MKKPIAFILTIAVLTGLVPFLSAQELKLKISALKPVSQVTQAKVNQIPHSKLATGNKNIKFVWLAGATTRYAHGVLGDSIEASKLEVISTAGKELSLELPSDRVFEDLIPRLVDINQDEKDEVMVIESHNRLGASLAIYALINQQIAKITSTPHLGTANRWLNPVGIGDFDGDGTNDIALVATPHIGGILRLYHYTEPHLTMFASFPQVSTHYIGSTELGLGIVVNSAQKDKLLLPNQRKRKLLLLEWFPTGIKPVAQVKLPYKLIHSILPIASNKWLLFLENQKYYQLTLISVWS